MTTTALMARWIGVTEEWLAALRRRATLIAVAAGAVFATFLFLALAVSPKFSGLLAVTVVNSELSYAGWFKNYGLEPLKGYLALVLAASTFWLTLLWFVVFRGENPILDAFVARPTRHPRIHRFVATYRRTGLFLTGVIPNVWPVGFIWLREKPVRGGLSLVLFGNGVKLTVVAVIYWLVPEQTFWGYVGIAGLIILSFFIASRLVERLLPGNGRNRALR